MKLIDRIRTYFTREEIEEEKIEVVKIGINVILLYCNYFDSHLENINIIFYLSFDEDKVNILDLMKYGRYDNSTHIFMTTYKELYDMRMENRTSDIVDTFFAQISDAMNLDTITNPREDKTNVSNALFNIIKTYAGYEDSNYANTCPEFVRSSILPQGSAVNIEFTITLDRIFTCLEESENDNFSSFFRNEILLNIFTEEDIDNLSYTRKKTDEEVQDDFDREIDEIIFLDEEGGDEDEN